MEHEQETFRAFGKTFSPGSPDDIPPDVRAAAEAAFAEFDARPPQVNWDDLPERFKDDLAGTEKDEWYRQSNTEEARDRREAEWLRQKAEWEQRQQDNP
ncbi:hypothetical protein IU450_17965 [Nocardia abscessus]|uniref:hypothetical protein n=1 Tax=Nocardia abscessus TaxID=120957 RepID=UPI0018961921|nr:hypothetical protein [Nocardia abscessus]MBF6337768.1 hypothetical protein [Nocardia abscessus]